MEDRELKDRKKVRAGWASYFIGLTLSVPIVFFITLLTGAPQYGATDPLNKRSGLSLYEDSGTGCQYISGFFGLSLTPRIASVGRSHLGCKENHHAR
jgi:hypothetical protein